MTLLAALKARPACSAPGFPSTLERSPSSTSAFRIRRAPVPAGISSRIADRSWLVLGAARSMTCWEMAQQVYIVAGSPGMTGAAQLSASGALRSGSGMVRLGSPGADPDRASVTEAVVRQLPDEGWADAVLEELPRCRALVVGPGLGTSPSSRAGVLERFSVRAEVPVVLDADGLNGAFECDHRRAQLRGRSPPAVLRSSSLPMTASSPVSRVARPVPIASRLPGRSRARHTRQCC